MLTLRLTQWTAGPNRHRVEVALEGDGVPRQTARVEFDFALKAQEREDLRWYLEDYLEHAADPAPRIAARIEHRMLVSLESRSDSFSIAPDFPFDSNLQHYPNGSRQSMNWKGRSSSSALREKNTTL